MRPDSRQARWCRFGVGMCAVACLLCPLSYVLRGTVMMTSWFGNITLLVPLAFSEIWLIRRLLFGATDRRIRARLIALDAVAAAVVVLFMYIAANLLFVQASWKAGYAAVDFLIACACALPISYWRRRTLAARLAWLPPGVSVLVFALVMLLAVATASSLWFVPPHYL